MELNDGIPGRSVLASDIKRYSMREAVIETARHCYSMMEEKHDYSELGKIILSSEKIDKDSKILRSVLGHS